MARKLRRSRLSAKCADILRSVISSRDKSKSVTMYEHADGHMDIYLL